MTYSRIKHFQIKLIPIGLVSMFILNNCASTDQQITPTINLGEWRGKYSVCRGKGTLVSAGPVRGRLTFSYTCSGEDVFIHFKDVLGRKTMMMIVRPNSVEAWDIMQNIRFSTESIYLRFPFFEVLKPMDLVSIFWGIVPDNLVKVDTNNPMTESAIDIRFSSDGLGLQAVYIMMDNEKQSIEMTFDEREFGSAYPHLIKQIPESTPHAQL